jgi:copper chaperone NosL
MKLFKRKLTFTLLIIFLTLTSCSKNPEQINYNEDECDYCAMRINDNRYASEIITNENKVYKFDSIKCLIGFALAKNILEDKSISLFVCDYSNPGKFIELKNSFITHNENFTSPMGLNVQAFSTEAARDKFITENGGTKISWDEVVKMEKESE